MTTNAALILIDVQVGFDDPVWGASNNPAAEANIAALLDGWSAAGQPVVLVRHNSRRPDSPLAPGTPGNSFAAVMHGVQAALVFGKSVNSAFHGEIDLHAWLTQRGIDEIVLAGVQTNMCVEPLRGLAATSATASLSHSTRPAPSTWLALTAPCSQPTS